MAGILDFLFGSQNDPNNPQKNQGILNAPVDRNNTQPVVNNGVLNQNAPQTVVPPADPNSFAERFKNADFGTHLMALSRGLAVAGSRDPVKAAMDYAAVDLENKKLAQEAARTKFTHIPNTPFFMSSTASGKTAITDSNGNPIQPGPNGQDPLDAWLKSNQAYQAQLWKDKAIFKGDIDASVNGSKLGTKQQLEDAPALQAATQDAATLMNLAGQLRQKPGFTADGGIAGALPKGVRDLIDEPTAKIQSDAEAVAQKQLKSILGAQYTENEGKAYFARFYNPKFSAETNAANLEKMGRDLLSMAQNKEATSAYLAKNGTLVGFKPPATSSGGGGDISSQATSAFGSYDPNVYEYRINNGVVQRRKK